MKKTLLALAACALFSSFATADSFMRYKSSGDPMSASDMYNIREQVQCNLFGSCDQSNIAIKPLLPLEDNLEPTRWFVLEIYHDPDKFEENTLSSVKDKVFTAPELKYLKKKWSDLYAQNDFTGINAYDQPDDFEEIAIEGTMLTLESYLDAQAASSLPSPYYALIVTIDLVEGITIWEVLDQKYTFNEKSYDEKHKNKFMRDLMKDRGVEGPSSRRDNSEF